MGKHYKFEIKLKIVQEYLNSSLGYERLAKKYSLSHYSILQRWVNQYLEFGPKGLDKKLQNKEYTRDFKDLDKKINCLIEKQPITLKFLIQLC
ncbi:helix-turn-helix domain-containing protein [Staphylococcus felis]|uniref:helix-turn-helix domain-containing protein n=1 Tax=Staphylococcus felis TaxID=46127 RepID=UPI00115CFA98|nr:helix-turn-helix domain-containing protein [Staphylococcus felis]